MDNFYWLLGSVFGGTFFGSFLGPLFLEEWRALKKKRNWAVPRSKALLEMFGTIDAPIISIGDLSRACGCSESDTRDLLIGLGARGTTLSNGMEGWYLDRHRMNFSSTNVDSQS